FIGESGQHSFRSTQATGSCLVDAQDRAMRDYVPPVGVDRKTGVAALARRRHYDLIAGTIEDVRLDGKLYANIDNLPTVLGQALERCLMKNIEGMLSE
ncbi:MAG TPA: hypothetical protein VFE62_04480, partial [Gemmataceae bacterium]|nr:hypothetical protein [Gemmataceae bacterium]